MTRQHDAAVTLDASPQNGYEAGLAGALCDDETRARLQKIGREFDWRSLP